MNSCGRDSVFHRFYQRRIISETEKVGKEIVNVRVKNPMEVCTTIQSH